MTLEAESERVARFIAAATGLRTEPKSGLDQH
jgi:hypothetical protein